MKRQKYLLENLNGINGFVLFVGTGELKNGNNR